MNIQITPEPNETRELTAVENARLLKQLLNTPDGMMLLLEIIADYRQAKADWSRLLGPGT